MEEFLTLRYEGNEHKIPILYGTDGTRLVDIQALYAKSQLFCYDPGYTITGSCASAISNATADGHLYYRGYSIEELVDKSTYEEVCFILLYGNRPSVEELREFDCRIKDEMMIHSKILDFYKGFRYDAHPMSIMCSVVAGLSSFIHSTLDIKDSL